MSDEDKDDHQVHTIDSGFRPLSEGYTPGSKNQVKKFQPPKGGSGVVEKGKKDEKK